MTVIGIDPGIRGGLAKIGPTMAYAASSAMPIMRAGRVGTKMQVDPYELAATLRGWDEGGVTVVVEDVHSMPRQGVASSFTFGRGLGRLEGVLAALTMPVVYVTPARWKRHFGLDADKKNAMALARRLYPAVHIPKNFEGVAEALLIARWYVDSRPH